MRRLQRGRDTATIGTLNGADYRVETPEHWNGTLILFSHGYVPAGIGQGNQPWAQRADAATGRSAGPDQPNRSGEVGAGKALIETLIAEIRITASDRVIPVFRIPQPRAEDAALDAKKALTEKKSLARATKEGVRAMTNLVDLGGTYYNTKPQVRALGELREKLPSFDAPEPVAARRDRPRRARQLGSDQVEQLIAGYRSGATRVRAR